MAALTVEGDSESWVQQKSNVARITDEFLRQDTELEPPWENQLESVLCAKPYYERLGFFLVEVYRIPTGVKYSGEQLRCDSILNYMGTAIQRAAGKFKASGGPETKDFLYCLDIKSSSDSSQWLQKLKKKIRRLVFERLKKSGAKIDISEGACDIHSLPPARRSPCTLFVACVQSHSIWSTSSCVRDRMRA